MYVLKSKTYTDYTEFIDKQQSLCKSVKNCGSNPLDLNKGHLF